MEKSMKRCLSLFLSVVMIFAMCWATASAEQTPTDMDSNVVEGYDIEELTNEAKSAEDNTYMATKIEQDIDATKEKINIAFDLNYTAKNGYVEAIFEGTGGQGSLITFNGTEITLGTQKIEEVASDGTYHVNADIDHAQQMLMVASSINSACSKITNMISTAPEGNLDEYIQEAATNVNKSLKLLEMREQ